MFVDAKLQFSAGQALTGTTDVNSTNVFDAGTAKKLFDGTGRAKLAITQSATGGTSPTLRARLVGADDAALSTNAEIIADTGVSRVLTSADVPRTIEIVPATQLTAKRYYGVIYTQSGTTPTATVTAQIVEAGQTNLLK